MVFHTTSSFPMMYASIGRASRESRSLSAASSSTEIRVEYLSKFTLLILFTGLAAPDGGLLICVTWREPDESEAEGWLLPENTERALRAINPGFSPPLRNGPRIGRHAAMIEAHGSMISQIRLFTTRAMHEIH